MDFELAYIVLGALGLALPPLFTRWKVATKRVSVRRDDALEAVKLMKDWGVWLTGIQTAAIAAIAAFFKSAVPPLGQLAVVFFSASIIADTILLAGLPSIVLRLKHALELSSTAKGVGTPSPEEASPDNDIYELRLFEMSAYGRRTGAVYVVSHIYFVEGILAFAAALMRTP